MVGVCPGGVLSWWGFVLVGFCPGGVLSWWVFVRNYFNRELSHDVKLCFVVYQAEIDQFSL